MGRASSREEGELEPARPLIRIVIGSVDVLLHEASKLMLKLLGFRPVGAIISVEREAFPRIPVNEATSPEEKRIAMLQLPPSAKAAAAWLSQRYQIFSARIETADAKELRSGILRFPKVMLVEFCPPVRTTLARGRGSSLLGGPRATTCQERTEVELGDSERTLVG